MSHVLVLQGAAVERIDNVRMHLSDLDAHEGSSTIK
jgi:hypothetical protein